MFQPRLGFVADYTPPLQLVILNTSTKQRVHQGAFPLSPPAGIGLGPGATPGLGGKPVKLRWLAFADNGVGWRGTGALLG